MKTILIFFTALSCLSFASCTSLTPDEVRERELERTRKYAETKEKQRIRREARDERTELWYDSIFRNEDDF